MYALLDQFAALVSAHRSPHHAVEDAGTIPAGAKEARHAMTTSSHALVKVSDGWDAAAEDASANPVRGSNVKFDGGAYVIGKEKTPVDDGKKYVIIDRAEGWQFLKKDCPAEWCMRQTGAPKPEQPHADESTWPIGLDGNPQHPWKYTYFLYLIDLATGETLTFSTSTSGGSIAVGDLTSQIKYMRNVRPGAVPIVELQSRQMSTKYGKKPRPFFQIKGWKVRDEDQPKMITAAANDDDSSGVTEVNALNDKLPW